VEGEHLLDVYALPLPRLAGADVPLPRTRWGFVLFAGLLILRQSLRLHLQLPMLCPAPHQYRSVVPLLDRPAICGVAARATALAAERGRGHH